MRTSPTRPWRGASAEERRAERRERLLDAGLELIGTQGSAAATVRAVCAEAGLTSRYFYEAFADNEALLLAVYERVHTQVVESMVGAVQAVESGDIEAGVRAAVTAGVHVLLDDPRRGRVMLQEATSNEVLQRRRRDDALATAALMAKVARESLGLSDTDEIDGELGSIAMAYAMSGLGAAYLAGRLDVSRERLIDHLSGLYLAAARVSSRPR